MVSNVSSITLSEQTSPICPWLMSWERKPRFPLWKKRESQDCNPGSLSLIPILLIMPVSIREMCIFPGNSRVPHFLVRLVKINSCTGMILEKAQTMCQEARVRKSILGSTLCQVTIPTCLLSLWIQALVLWTAPTLTCHSPWAAPTDTDPNISTTEPSTPQCLQKMLLTSPVGVVPISSSNIMKTLTTTFITCSHPVCPSNTGCRPASSTVAVPPIFRVTGQIPIKVSPKPGQHVASLLWSSPHPHTVPATPIRIIRTKPGPRSNQHLLLCLTRKGQKCERNCEPSSTRTRWTEWWKCSHSWWILKSWLQRYSSWKIISSGCDVSDDYFFYFLFV